MLQVRHRNIACAEGTIENICEKYQQKKVLKNFSINWRNHIAHNNKSNIMYRSRGQVGTQKIHLKLHYMTSQLGVNINN